MKNVITTSLLFCVVIAMPNPVAAQIEPNWQVWNMNQSLLTMQLMNQAREEGGGRPVMMRSGISSDSWRALQEENARERQMTLANYQGPVLVQKYKTFLNGQVGTRFKLWNSFFTEDELASAFHVLRRAHYVDSLTKVSVALEPLEELHVRVLAEARKYFEQRVLFDDELYQGQLMNVSDMDRAVAQGIMPDWPVDRLPNAVPESGRQLWSYLQWNYPGVKVRDYWDSAWMAASKSAAPSATKDSVIAAASAIFVKTASEQLAIKGVDGVVPIHAVRVANSQQMTAETFWANWQAANPGIPGRKIWDEQVKLFHDAGLEGDALSKAAEAAWGEKVHELKSDPVVGQQVPPQ